MANKVTDKVAEAGHATAEAAKNVGHKIAAGAEKAADYIKEKTGVGGRPEGSNVGVSGIEERMEVIASCGKKVGVVDHVEGAAIKLTKNDSPDGQHHFIPFGWIERVDGHVHLTKNSMETERDWKPSSTSCGCGD